MATDNSTPGEDREPRGARRNDRPQGGGWSNRGGSDRPAPRRDDDRRGSRPDGERRSSWGNRDDDRRGPRQDGERRSFGNRDDRGPRREGKGRPWENRGERREDDRRGPRADGERRSWGSRDDNRGSRPDGERRSFGSRDDRGPRREGQGRPWDNRGERRDDDRRGPRPDGERRSWGNRDDNRGSRPDGERRSWGNRDDNRGPRPDGERRSYGNRDDNRGPRRDDDRRGPRRDRDFEPREERIHRPGTAPRADEPETPRDFVEAELPFGVRAELKGLPKELADIVGAHIWAAGQLVDTDPELAFRHAEAARRRAGRLAIVREAAAETAYAAGEYAVALREFRAIRRMNGGDELIPVIADCERALGRPRDALEILASLDPQTKDVNLRIECLIVEAGIRNDLGQRSEALRLLKAAISRKIGAPIAQARLRYVYADLLETDGDETGAREWFTAAATLDPQGQLDTADRIATLDGVVLPDFNLDDDEDEEDFDEDGDILPEDDEDEDGDLLPADEPDEDADEAPAADEDQPEVDDDAEPSEETK